MRGRSRWNTLGLLHSESKCTRCNWGGGSIIVIVKWVCAFWQKGGRGRESNPTLDYDDHGTTTVSRITGKEGARFLIARIRILRTKSQEETQWLRWDVRARSRESLIVKSQFEFPMFQREEQRRRTKDETTLQQRPPSGWFSEESLQFLSEQTSTSDRSQRDP